MYLSGPCIFNFTLNALPEIRELGFNEIEVSTGPSSVFPNSAEPTGKPRIIDSTSGIKTGQLREVLDRCAELGLKVDLGMTAHQMPQWVFKQWPDARNASPNFMLPYDIEHPEVKRLLKRWYEIVMPQIAGHPALNSIWVANEPGYLNPNQRNVAIFRSWLEQKYGTMARLNKAWGTHLESFEQISPGAGRAYIPGGAATQAAQADWWWYSSERLARHFAWFRDLVHQYDPKLPVSIKLFNATFNPQFKPPMRANEEPIEDLMEIEGYDGGSYPFAKSYADFLRSLSPKKPLANLEYKFGSPPQRTKLDFWKEAMKGASLNDWWCWHPKPTFSPVPGNSIALYEAAMDQARYSTAASAGDGV